MQEGLWSLSVEIKENMTFGHKGFQGFSLLLHKDKADMEIELNLSCYYQQGLASFC